MEYKNILELVKKRRSIRRFKTDPIPDDHIDKIIEVARHAPSVFNIQPWEFIVIKDRELKGRIVDLLPAPNALFDQADFRIAPVYIIELCDPRTKAGLPEVLLKNEKISETLIFSSLANSFLYMMLAATSLGLTCQRVSPVDSPDLQPKLKNLIGIPDVFMVYAMLALGYPAKEPAAKLLRDKAGMVHFDYCMTGEFRTDEEVSAFTKRTHDWSVAQHKH